MPAEGAQRPTTVDIVLPVLNERHVLEDSVRRLRRHLETMRGFESRIVIADNGSSDGTLDAARRLARLVPGVSVRHLRVRGRGRALRQVWTESTADVVAYMDIDLSTDLGALQPLLELVASGRADVATGSRLAPGAHVTRGVRRELISRAYNALLHEALDMPVGDAQCGFKAVRASVAHALLPSIEDEEWFFDTELLARAQRAGYRVAELPVRWVEDRDSRVRLMRTALADVRGVWRLRRDGFRPVRAGITAQLAAFTLIGLISTVAYIVLFNVLRPETGAQIANLVSLAVTAVANTAANRRFTFHVRGTRGLLRAQLAGGVSLVIAIVVTAGALGAVHAVEQSAPALLDSAVLLIATVASTVVRFAVLRLWLTTNPPTLGTRRARAVS